MESRGPGIYNPLLERCPASPSPPPGLRRPRMCRKDVTLGGGCRGGIQGLAWWGWYTASDRIPAALSLLDAPG